jgi:hypothetical protein
VKKYIEGRVINSADDIDEHGRLDESTHEDELIALFEALLKMEGVCITFKKDAVTNKVIIKSQTKNEERNTSTEDTPKKKKSKKPVKEYSGEGFDWDDYGFDSPESDDDSDQLNKKEDAHDDAKQDGDFDYDSNNGNDDDDEIYTVPSSNREVAERASSTRSTHYDMTILLNTNSSCYIDGWAEILMHAVLPHLPQEFWDILDKQYEYKRTDDERLIRQEYYMNRSYKRVFLHNSPFAREMTTTLLGSSPGNFLVGILD